MGKIDFDKFICALMEQESSKTDYNGIRNALKSCGYKYTCGQLIELESKQEPKFKVGEWVIFNNNRNSIYRIEKSENYQYTLRHFLGGSMPLSYSNENMIRRWTIQDAKDGDVLACGDEVTDCPFIYNGKINHSKEFCGAFCGIIYDFTLSQTKHHWTYIECVTPATKEQRDTLFAKMKEAGYEWDAEKKELKKIEQKFIEPDDIIEESYQQQADDLIDMVTEKPAWSEEDERMFHTIIADLKGFKHGSTSTLAPHFDNCIAWLKSLKERYTWKPSEEQMNALRQVISGCSYDIEPLVEIEEQLKKLYKRRVRV